MSPKTDAADDELPRLTLDNLAAGAVRELFEQELDRVLANILDPNTPATAKRSIRLDITIEPNEARNACSTGVEASSKLAPFKGAGGVIFVGRRKGQPIALVNDMEQTQLDWDRDAAPKPLPAAPTAKATGS